MAFLDGGPSLRKAWERLRSQGRPHDPRPAERLRWHSQDLRPKVDVEDKAAVQAALGRR